MTFVGGLIGGLLITFLVSRMVGWIIRRWVHDPAKLLFANASTLLITTVLGGYGFADGGDPQFAFALVSYAIPVLIWVAYDFYRWKKAPASG